MLNGMTESGRYTPDRNSSSASRRRLPAAMGLGTLFAGALAYVGLVDPHHPDSIYPQCPFKMLTGWNCPACGGLRMTHDLLHGHFAAAVVDNMFLLVGIPALIAWVVYRSQTGRSVAPRAMWVVVLVSAIAWTVTRNLPGFPLVPTLYGR
jgi:Protein of unknown function (DUF2752)